MPIQFNHTVVYAHNREISARFLTELFGLPDPTPMGPFLAVALANGVTLDYYSSGPDALVANQHLAFLVSEEDFDAIFARIQERGIPYRADPHGRRPGEINTNDGGRGVYFQDPSDHDLEIITVPYGGFRP